MDIPPIYQIQVKGYLEPGWLDLFEGLSVIQEEDGVTTLSGPLPDQAALHGVLKRINNLGLTLISVHTVTAED